MSEYTSEEVEKLGAFVDRAEQHGAAAAKMFAPLISELLKSVSGMDRSGASSIVHSIFIAELVMLLEGYKSNNPEDVKACNVKRARLVADTILETIGSIDANLVPISARTFKIIYDAMQDEIPEGTTFN